MKHFIILFDGICNLCNKSVQFTIKKDPTLKFKFASIQSEIGQKLLRTYGLPINDLDTFILIKGNKHYTKSSAALHVFKELKGLWKLLYIFIISPKPIRDYFYNLIARNRYKIFGKKDTCMIPSPSIEKRFL